jgi:hypothetical protein
LNCNHANTRRSLDLTNKPLSIQDLEFSVQPSADLLTMPSAIKSENAHYIPVQSQSVGHNAPEALSGADFGIMHSRFYLIPRETFQNWRGSKEITTRRFRPSVQDETPDVLEQVDFSAPRNLA